MELLKVILQGISSLAIAGGLVFTAVQFMNYRKAQRVANFAKMVELQMHLREMRVNDPSLATVYRHDVQALEDDEQIRQYFFNLMQLSVYEIVWYAYVEGQLTQDYFDSWTRRMRDIASERSFRTMMNNPSMKILHDDFQAYIMRMIREVAPDEPPSTGPIHPAKLGKPGIMPDGRKC